ncbi:MAG: hypothetical protein HDS36_05310 [Bacteroides sp.]|nr:hypothetical protein [Bacteroides sp.]
MNSSVSVNNLIADCLEIHYFTDNGEHQIDAFALTKCSSNLLDIISVFSKKLNVNIKINTLALGEGGIKQWLKIVKEQEDKTAPITTEVIKYLVLSALGIVGFIGHEIYQYIREDHELADLKKEALIKYLEDSDIQNSEKLENKVSKLRSNFYESASKATNISSISFSSINTDGDTEYERNVNRASFPTFILTDNTLNPIDIEDATILITSPVIAKAKYNKWHGIYNNENIEFKMLSNEFKHLVQSGEVTFKNGFSINCFLRIYRSLNEKGEERITKYEVIRVNNYYNAEIVTETQEGKSYRKKKYIDNSQNLFTGIEKGF